MAEQIRQGTGQGLIEFIDYLIDKGYAPPAAGNNWKGATKNVLNITEGEGWETFGLQELDVDEYLGRFAVKARGQIKEESVRAYRSRFTAAVDAYRGFLNDENWKPPTFAAGRKRNKPPAQEDNGERQATVTPITNGNGNGRGQTLIDYPFPLRSGEIAHFRLPVKLEKDDAERMAVFIRTLVFEPRRELPPGEEAA